MDNEMPAFQLSAKMPDDMPDQALWMIFSGSKILVRSAPQQTSFGGCIIPLTTGKEELGFPIGEVFCIGYYQGLPCFAALALQPITDGEYRFVALRALFAEVEESLWYAAGRAFQIAEWDKTTRFCGACATATEPVPQEHAKRCPNCELLHYPRVTPAVIVLVRRFDRHEPEILLTRSVRFPDGMYSLQAGFVEAGESLEEAVHREIEEETGIRVQNLRYFGSQSWPFPHSLMIAFVADYHSGELRLDPSELTDGNWYTLSNLPPIPPRISIARALIDFALEEQGQNNDTKL